jgi:hypothetical protein
LAFGVRSKDSNRLFVPIKQGKKYITAGPDLDNAGITIIPEPFSDNSFLAKKKAGSVKRVTEDLSAAKRIQDSETERA